MTVFVYFCLQTSYSVYLSVIKSTACTRRVLWGPCKCVKSLPEPWAGGLPWFPKDTAEPVLSAFTVSLYSFPQHDGGLPCNYLHKWAHFTSLLFDKSNSDPRFTPSSQDLPVQKQSDLVQDFYQSFAEYFKSEYRWDQHIPACLFWKHQKRDFWVSPFVSRFSWSSGHSDNGTRGEADNDTSPQMGFLPWQLWWWTEGSGSTETNTVTLNK